MSVLKNLRYLTRDDLCQAAIFAGGAAALIFGVWVFLS